MEYEGTLIDVTVYVTLTERPNPNWRPTWDEPPGGYSWEIEAYIEDRLISDANLLDYLHERSEEIAIQNGGGVFETDVELMKEDGKIYIDNGENKEVVLPVDNFKWEIIKIV